MPTPETAAVRGTTMARGTLATVGVLLTLAGAAIIVGGLLAVPESGVVQFFLALVGVVVAFLGVDRLLWAARRRRTDLLVIFSAAWVLLLGAAALLAPVLPLGEHADVKATITNPVYQPPFVGSDFLLGTNLQGLDLLARAVYGARASLTISLGAILIGVVVGGAIGIIAGFYQKKVDTVIGVLTNAVLAVPPLILLIVLATALQPRIRNMMFALALLTIPTMVRLARANTIAFSQRPFVLAARTIGATRLRIMVRELLPNVLPPMLSLAVVVISGLIVAEASLSFLGLGIPQPEPTWGNMISEANAKNGLVMQENPHMLLVPGMFLFLTVFSFNLLGEKAQKRWDPRGAKV